MKRSIRDAAIDGRFVGRACRRENVSQLWDALTSVAARPAEIGEYVSALSNSAILADRDRAFVVFGIADKTLTKIGTAKRLADIKFGGEALLNWLARSIQPTLLIQFHDFDCGGLKFAIIEIEPTYFKPVTFKGNAFIRIGEHKKRLSDFPDYERSIWLATSRRTFENAVAKSYVHPEQINGLLDIDAFFSLMGSEVPQSTIELAARLADHKILIDEYEGSYAITNLGALLLARDIAQFPSVSRKTVRVVKYRGADVQDPGREFTGTKGYAAGFQGLISFISRNAEQREIIEGGLRRSVSIIPEIAIREIVANALIHQDLNAGGSSPLIEIFSNRIEISNAGKPLQDVERLIDCAPISRNEQLAKAMSMLHICEERGRGLDKALLAIEAQSANAAVHMPAPEFRSTGTGFVATLHGPRQFKDLTKQDKLRATYQHCVLAYLNKNYMSNSTLRARFSLKDDDYQIVSAIIAQSIEARLISPADSDQGRKTARYVPAWARPR